MRIFPPAVEIADDEGFTPTKDIFQRSRFGEGLTNLVSSSDDPLVIVLDSPWGSGKTTFIKMWAGHLRKNGFPVIYFDAFEHDHVDNGFLAIAAQVLSLSTSLKKSKTPAHKNFLKKAARAGGVLLRTGAKIGVKAATLGAIDAADIAGLQSVADDIAREASTKADEYVENLLKIQSQEKETLNSLKQALSELAGALSSSDEESKRPLIFIIDELDRCRPSFALELLEKIKHIFSISNVHFVLATHLEQLEVSVRFNYGQDIDARTYLQKFFNVITHFPEAGSYKSERTIPKYIAYLRTKMGFKEDDLGMLQHVAEARRLSLRTIERIATCIALAKQFTPENYLWLEPIIVGLCIIKVLDPTLFVRAREGAITLDQVKEAFAVSGWPEDSSGQNWAVEWWTYCLAKEEKDFPNFDWKGFRSSLFQYSIRDRRDIVRLMAGHIDRFQLPKAG
jgi:hypothetical protein